MKRTIMLVGIGLCSLSVQAEVVKLSKSGICHDSSSTWYEKTTNYTAYQSLEACLEVGRLPKGAKSTSTKASKKQGTYPTKYDRKDYPHWTNLDSDPRNTRHDLLEERSTALVTYSKSGNTVVKGKWFDPYTGETFYNSSELDIDHVVSLGYSFPRGSKYWTRKQKEDFANDPQNLLIVKASENRKKGSKGPTEYMPPRQQYGCQYLARFHLVMKKYKLDYFKSEARTVRKMLDSCGLQF